MSLIGKHTHSLIDAISDPACFVNAELSVLYANRAFYHFSGIEPSQKSSALKFDTCFSITHSWYDDDIIRMPFKKNSTAFHNSIKVKNAINTKTTVSIHSIPFLNGAGNEVESTLLILRETGGELYNDQILELIEQQEEKLRGLEGMNGESLHTNAQLKCFVEKQHRQLRQANNTLRKVKEEINDELEMAKSVQSSLMPRDLPAFTNISLASAYIPAGKVGGDFYDIINTQSQKIAILIFDVSGHGVPAALIGATAKMLFAHYIEVMESPAMIFHEVNSKICSFLQTEHYLTAFLGILDPIQNTMIYSRAGHVKPIVYHADTREVSTLDARGCFIGHSALVDIAEYREETVGFNPDDKILFYTDGLTEGCNPRNEMYGKERLVQAVKKYGELSRQQMLDRIIDEQSAFREGMELRDDFTTLCIQIGDSEYLLKESGFTKQDAPHILIVHKMNEIEKVCSVILRAMDTGGFDDDEIKRSKICIFELIINSLLHGNREDPRKNVLVLYKVEHERISISIVDEGDGYDYRSLPDPCVAENVLKDHGRGVYIVRKFMDEIHYNAKGNRILVVKYHRGVSPAWK